MSVYNLVEYSHNYSKTSGSLWHYYRDEPFLGATDAIPGFPIDNNNSVSFKFKTKIVGKLKEKANTKNVEIEYH